MLFRSGWQDQYGGVLRGVKLLQTHAGMDQSPLVRWLPDYLFTGGEYQKCHLLYYTGITRTAKGILAEIVRSMFLNSTEHLSILGGMKGHALDLYEAIQRGNFDEMGRLVGKSWKLNQALDPGTNPEAVETIIRRIDDYCLGYKLPGAGGGGYCGVYHPADCFAAYGCGTAAAGAGTDEQHRGRRRRDPSGGDTLAAADSCRAGYHG